MYLISIVPTDQFDFWEYAINGTRDPSGFDSVFQDGEFLQQRSVRITGDKAGEVIGSTSVG